MKFNQLFKFYLIIIVSFLLNACATYNIQIKDGNSKAQIPDKEIDHTFYLIGDAGNSEQGQTSEALNAFKAELKNATKNSTAIFLGDNIYERGLPGKNETNRNLAKHRLQVQIETVKNFIGTTLFIPGNHDWYSGIKGLKRQEEYIEEKLGKNTFFT